MLLGHYWSWTILLTSCPCPSFDELAPSCLMSSHQLSGLLQCPLSWARNQFIQNNLKQQWCATGLVHHGLWWSQPTSSIHQSIAANKVAAPDAHPIFVYICSVASVACIWNIELPAPPPTLFGVSCRENFVEIRYCITYRHPASLTMELPGTWMIIRFEVGPPFLIMSVEFSWLLDLSTLVLLVIRVPAYHIGQGTVCRKRMVLVEFSAPWK